MITSNINNNFMEDMMFNKREPFHPPLNTFRTLFKHSMVNGRLLNKLILYNTALRIYNEVKTWHMDVIFMSPVYNIYV
jgi:hypothetical protein